MAEGIFNIVWTYNLQPIFCNCVYRLLGWEMMTGRTAIKLSPHLSCLQRCKGRATCSYTHEANYISSSFISPLPDNTGWNWIVLWIKSTLNGYFKSINVTIPPDQFTYYFSWVKWAATRSKISKRYDWIEIWQVKKVNEMQELYIWQAPHEEFTKICTTRVSQL